MKTKIEIKSILGTLIFTYEAKNSSIKDAIIQAVKENADLRYADLSNADLRYANLRDADLRDANLRDADLSGADLRDANLSGADLRDADLSGADLRYADLRDADLSGADLRYADLRYANLSGADLRDADLRNADLNKRFIQISCIGSCKRMTTYCFDDDIIWCGCFKGSLESFETKVKETHKNNERYLKEYLGAINYIKSLIQ
jgi:uncharacterized protein YjbI with pentapeptide repeats